MVSDLTDYRCVKRGSLAQLDSRLSEVQTNHEQIGCNFTFSKAYEQQIYVTAVLFHMWSKCPFISGAWSGEECSGRGKWTHFVAHNNATFA